MFRAFWAHNRREEKVAFEAFIDFVIAALVEDPAIHGYHYAPYEPSALKRLMGHARTREAEVDRLLRGKVLVDLYAVTLQALRLSKPGYSIKQVEAFYMGARDQAVSDAGDSIVRFEEWPNVAFAVPAGWSAAEAMLRGRRSPDTVAVPSVTGR